MLLVWPFNRATSACVLTSQTMIWASSVLSWGKLSLAVGEGQPLTVR